MSDQILGLFDLPELPERDSSKESFGNPNINYFITKKLYRVHAIQLSSLILLVPNLISGLTRIKATLTVRFFFVEKLSVWCNELLPWLPMVEAAEECLSLPAEQSCVHHGGVRHQCKVNLPMMWSSNKLALAHLIKTCILYHKKKSLTEGKPQKVDGDYKISANRPDLVADVLIESG